MARLVRVPVSIELWQQIMTEGYEGHFRCIEGLPEGAELVHSYYEGNPPTAFLVFHHPSFANVPILGELPPITPVFQRVFLVVP